MHILYTKYACVSYWVEGFVLTDKGRFVYKQCVCFDKYKLLQ